MSWSGFARRQSNLGSAVQWLPSTVAYCTGPGERNGDYGGEGGGVRTDRGGGYPDTIKRQGLMRRHRPLVFIGRNNQVRESNGMAWMFDGGLAIVLGG